MNDWLKMMFNVVLMRNERCIHFKCNNIKGVLLKLASSDENNHLAVHFVAAEILTLVVRSIRGALCLLNKFIIILLHAPASLLRYLIKMNTYKPFHKIQPPILDTHFKFNHHYREKNCKMIKSNKKQNKNKTKNLIVQFRTLF